MKADFQVSASVIKCMVTVIRKRQGGRTGLGKSNEFNCECAELSLKSQLHFFLAGRIMIIKNTKGIGPKFTSSKS